MDHEHFLPYGKHFIASEDIEAVAETLKSEWITRGPRVEEFEAAISSYCGAKYGVAFSSGTAALMAACHTAGLGPFDKVITTPNTFVATVGAAIQRKATPIFVDIDLSTGNFNLEHVKHTLQSPISRGKQVVIPVHFAGIAVDMERLDRALVHPESMIIEDAAHALGSCYPDGQKVGCCSHSAMTIFSFHPVKHITTGEGGMVTTNDENLFHLLKRFRNNGIERGASWFYEVHELTGNYHLNEIQAALGLSQLKRLDHMSDHRRELVAAYREHFSGVPGLRMFDPEVDSRTAYHLFVVQIDFASHHTTREAVMTQLMERGIGTQVHYIPVYRHPFFTSQGGDLSPYFPAMESYYAQSLTLPLFYEMSFSDVDRVAKALQEVLIPK